MLPTNYGENAYWIRFSKYETYKNEKGVYIIPSQKAERITYNPFDIGDKLITDYLKFGKALSEGIGEIDKINGALNLVKKYGLLGVLTFNEFSFDRLKSRIPDFMVIVFDDNGGYSGEKPFQEYVSEFFPLPDRQPLLNFKEEGSQNDDLIKDLFQFENNYSERVGWIARKAVELYGNFKRINDFKNIKEIENVPDMEYFHKVISCRYKIENINLSIYYDEEKGAYLNWEAENLYKMIDILYAIKLIDKKNGLFICENCGTPFLKHRKDMKYCSNECGNSYRVKKYRKPNGGE